jgi:flagellar biosynthesis chaperone FliJ
MPYIEQIESTKQKLAETKQTIKELQEKKASVTNVAELKSINKQINALQEEIGKLKSDIRLYASLNRDAIRDYHEMVLGDLD